MVTNIFPERNQIANEILCRNNPSEVLVVPVDFAKKTHVAQVARGTGEYLYKRPLNVHNTDAGACFLLEKVEKHRQKYRIPKGNVLFGGEDPGEYAWNFILRIQSTGYQFVRVNAKEAKKHRTNTRATSDELALAGIAQTVLLRRSYSIEQHDEIFGTMKRAERTRRKLICAQTAVKNRIHRDVDVLLPGFLKEGASGCPPFSEASLELMEDRFSVVQIRRMRLETLTKRLRKAKLHKPEQVAASIKTLAENALPPAPSCVAYFQKSLAAKVRHLRSLRENIRLEENEMARSLVQTPGFLLTTIPGLGIVLAGGIVAEYGNPDSWPHPNKMASYAGIVARHYQSGGPDIEPVSGHLPIDANHHLKDQLLQAAYYTGRFTHPAWQQLKLPGEHPLYEHYQRVEMREGRSRLSTAKKLLVVARAMMRERAVYLPPNALSPGTSGAISSRQYVEYLSIVRNMLNSKWKKYDLDGIPDDRNQITQWMENVDELTAFVRKQDK